MLFGHAKQVASPGGQGSPALASTCVKLWNQLLDFTNAKAPFDVQIQSAMVNSNAQVAGPKDQDDAQGLATLCYVSPAT